MNKIIMKENIDNENGIDFSKNIDLGGYNFYKNNSFISFRLTKVDGIILANIKYIYADNKKDLMSVIIYAINFWTGMKVKFIYYKEKEKDTYVINKLKELGFNIFETNPPKWKNKFKCKKCVGECKCKIIEACS